MVAELFTRAPRQKMIIMIDVASASDDKRYILAGGGACRGGTLGKQEQVKIGL